MKRGPPIVQDKNPLFPKTPNIPEAGKLEICKIIIQLDALDCNTYAKTDFSSTHLDDISCPCCNAKHHLTRHAKYLRYLLDWVSGELVFSSITITRVMCHSCGTTHALLPADIVAYCQYSFPFLIWIYSQTLAEMESIPVVAETCTLSAWSVYLVMKRYQCCFTRIALTLYESGHIPVDSQRFELKESLDLILAYGENRFRRLYWQNNHRYLWQTKFHNRASPPVHMGWEIGQEGFSQSC